MNKGGLIIAAASACALAACARPPNQQGYAIAPPSPITTEPLPPLLPSQSAPSSIPQPASEQVVSFQGVTISNYSLRDDKLWQQGPDSPLSTDGNVNISCGAETIFARITSADENPGTTLTLYSTAKGLAARVEGWKVGPETITLDKFASPKIEPPLPNGDAVALRQTIIDAFVFCNNVAATAQKADLKGGDKKTIIRDAQTGETLMVEYTDRMQAVLPADFIFKPYRFILQLQS